MHRTMKKTNGHGVDFVGCWALVTGASSGIGEAIAIELAKQGLNLVLVARRGDRLQALATGLRTAHTVDVRTLAVDLTQQDAPAAIHRFTQNLGLEVDILVNNAGMMGYGEFWRSDLQIQLGMVQLNCQSVLHLTHLFVQGMIARRRGKILVVATTTLAPAPYITTYAATKGFDLLFAEGIGEELARYGIQVSTLCPGPTQTDLYVDPNGTGHAGLQSAQSVAQSAVKGLMAGQRYIRPSLMARVIANLPRFLPRATVSGGTERLYRPSSLQDSPRL